MFDKILSNIYTHDMETPDIPNDPLSRFSLSIFVINGLLMRSGESVTRPLGLSSAKWQVLGRAGHQPQTVAQMAREMGNSRQNVQYTADTLVKQGLVAYRDNPNDRRAQLLEATPEGLNILERIYARNYRQSQQLIADLDPKQLVEISDALNTIARTFESRLEEYESKDKDTE
jgi:DNA-binding MarR family transcriptional regulator